MKATLIVDTQNIYGASGDALGRRCKPDPVGLVEAFGHLGFEVAAIHIAIALPDEQDAKRAALELTNQCRPLDRIEAELSRVVLPGGLARQLDGVRSHLRTASTLAAWRPDGGLSMVELLEATNTAAQAVVAELVPSARELSAVIDGLVAASAGITTRVPGSWVQGTRTLVGAHRKLEVVTEAVESISSYGYAGAANISYKESLPEAARGATVSVLEGRFRRGRDGATPGEKQVDTLCAIACVELARDAAATGLPHAVVVLSDDDDLTPALARAAEDTASTATSVVVAGTETVGSRHGSGPQGPGVPQWLTLDAASWCRVCGIDPVSALVQRNVLASLALGNRAVFTIDGDTATTSTGLTARLDQRDTNTSGTAALGVARLQWGRSGGRPLPGVVVGTRGGQVGGAMQARARRAQGTRVGVRHLPIDLAGTPAEVLLGVPGWWMAGDELVVVAVAGARGVTHRVLGYAPGFDPPGASAEARSAEVLTLSGEWAEVASGSDSWSVYVRRGIELTPGDRVVVCPYERSARTGPNGRRFAPRAILLSSALG